MKRPLLLVGLFLVVCLCLVGCGGGSLPHVAGPWEIIATSGNRNPRSGWVVSDTFIEVNFNEDSHGNLSASDPILFALQSLSSDGPFNAFGIGGFCGLPGPNPISGSVKTNDNMNFTWTEGAGVQFTGSGQLHNGTVTGSYSGGGASCTDVGTFVARPAQNIAGNYAGAYPLFSGGVASLTLTITAANGDNITVNGTDSVYGKVTLQGTQTGNCAVVSGTYGVFSGSFYGLVVKDNTNTTQLVFAEPGQSEIIAVLPKQ